MSCSATNARECRRCRNGYKMVRADQPQAARSVHTIAIKTNAICLDCHKGAVHNIPSGSGGSAPTPDGEIDVDQGNGRKTSLHSVLVNARSPRDRLG